MEVKRLITHFTYRVEPKPEGGFIAHASDPTLPPLEAATREELQQKIQANIAAGLSTIFPGLKPSPESKELKLSFHIEHKPGGGFSIHSSDPNAPSIEGGTHQEIENAFAEKLIGFVGKHMMPELSQALAANGNSGDVKVYVNRKLGLTVTKKVSVRTAGAETASAQPATIIDGQIADANTTAGATNPLFHNSGLTLSNSPITPQTSSSWKIFVFLLAVVVIAALMYFVFYHR